MIDRLYTTLQVISNKDVRGNLTPEEFNLLLNNAIEERYEENFFEFNRALNRQNRGLGGNSFADLPEKIKEKILHYHTKGLATKTGSVYSKPSNARYIISLVHNGITVPVAKNADSFYIMKNTNLVGIKESKPVALEYDSTFEVLPITITNDIEIFYLRQPNKAKWTYNTATGLFNPDALDFEDVDAHPSEEENLLRKLIAKLGINLKDTQLVQYGVGEETQEFNQENVI